MSSLRPTPRRSIKPTKGDEQFTNRVILFERMTQRNISVHFVGIAATFFGAGDIPSLNEVADDCLSRAFRDANEFSNITSAEIGVAGEAHQDMAVIGEKGPARLRCATHGRPLLRDVFPEKQIIDRVVDRQSVDKFVIFAFFSPTTSLSSAA